MSYRKFLKYTSYVTIPITWYYIGTHERKYVKESMYDKGFNLSQKFKNYKMWDNFIEPILVKQFSILFAGGNSFIQGMISDNENKEIIKKSLSEYKKNIQEELNELNEFDDKNETILNQSINEYKRNIKIESIKINQSIDEYKKNMKRELNKLNKENEVIINKNINEYKKDVKKGLTDLTRE